MSEPILDQTVVKTEIDIAIHSPLTNRSYEQYMDYLGINEGDLGKMVLDLGSGRAEKFARQAHENGINVISVNSILADPNNPTDAFNSQELKMRSASMSWDKIATEDIGKTVVAIAQQLPFPDETFDGIVSLYAIPFHIYSNHFEQTFKEIWRVLKPNGKGFFGPVRMQREEIGSLLRKTKIRYEFLPYNEHFGDGLKRYTLKIEK